MNKPPRRNALEPLEEVPQLLAQRAAARTKPKRDRSWDAARTKATYDLPSSLIQRINEIAEELGEQHGGGKAKVADVARLLLEAGIERYEAGALEVRVRPAKLRLYD